ncbi:Transcriptional-Regulating Factor 1 [Manis pentadactyla]|nr:Transcriptional-Regulating Factor 1 [Manis pentadactyla]
MLLRTSYTSTQRSGLHDAFESVSQPPAGLKAGNLLGSCCTEDFPEALSVAVTWPQSTRDYPSSRKGELAVWDLGQWGAPRQKGWDFTNLKPILHGSEREAHEDTLEKTVFWCRQTENRYYREK